MGLLPDQFLDLTTRPDADALDDLPPLPDRNLLLGAPLHEQICADPHEIWPFLVILDHLDSERIRELLAEFFERGFAHQFGGQKTQRSIAQLVLGVEGR